VVTFVDAVVDRVEARFRPDGVLANVESRRLAVIAALAGFAATPLLTVPFVIAHGVAGETTMLVANLLLLVIVVGGLGVFVWTGSTRVAGWANLGALVGLAVAGHVVLGGLLWSGGYLLWLMLACILATVITNRRDTLVLTALCALAVVALAPLEGSLQASRQQPLLGYSVFLLVGFLLTALCFLIPYQLVSQAWIRTEQSRNRMLMLNILPETIADRLKTEPGMIADRYDGCTIVFADLVGFTAHSKGKDPALLVGELNTIFTRFDALAEQYGAEKIKTIGDGYMAATGLPNPDPAHIAHACDLALAMVEAMPALNAELGTDFALRVGVNTGSAVAGVVGTSKFSYDVWGDTVNLASRLESNGAPGVVAVSASVTRALDERHTVEALGTRDLKGQGPTELYRLTHTRSVPA